MNFSADLKPSNGASANGSANGANGSHVSAPPVGRVTSPPRHESTADRFFFWVERGRLVEKMQVVHTACTIEGQEYQFYGVVEEVLRVARQRDVSSAHDRYDGRSAYEPPLHQEGVTYASVRILRVEPEVLAPPLEDALVYLGDEAAAAKSYAFDEMERDGEPLSIGQLRNGGSALVGPAKIDLDYLLGTYAGHLNITGMTGAGTKTSFLLILVKLLLHKALTNGARKPLHLVPIILNVKARDLMWIDKPNREFTDADRADWTALGVEPGPFADARFFAPALAGDPEAPDIDRLGVQSYCWSLKDVLANELFRHLFDDADISPAMEALAFDLAVHLTQDDDITLRPEAPQTWKELLEWLRAQAIKRTEPLFEMHSPATLKAVYRRLWDILGNSRGLFPPESQDGKPLLVPKRQTGGSSVDDPNALPSQTCGPLVVDINALPSSLQRFVVAAIVRQVVRERIRHPSLGLCYVLVLDELNRFAPHGAKDGITRLLKEVALERRSQGVILFGAQQFASQVASEIVESAAVRVLGRTGAGELEGGLWKGWDSSLKRQAANLRREDKLLSLPTFRQPMLVKMPRPAWAMRPDQVGATKTLEQSQAQSLARSQKNRS